MKNLLLLFFLLGPVTILAQGFYGSNMFTQNFANCEGVGGTMAIHVDNNGVYGPVEVILTFDGDTIAVTNAVAFDTTISTTPGQHTLVAFFTEAQGGPGSGQNLAIASWQSLLISCNAVLACTHQVLVSYGGNVAWYIDGNFAGVEDTLSLMPLYAGDTVQVLGVSPVDSTVIAFSGVATPQYGVQVQSVLDDSCSTGTGQIVMVQTGPWATFYSWSTGDSGMFLTELDSLTSGTYTLVVSSTNGVCSEEHEIIVGDTCNISTIVTEVSTEAFMVFPNPANSQVTLQLNQSVQGGSICDMTGRVVETIPQNARTLDVSQLTPGQYVVRVHSDNKLFTARFQKE